MVQSRAVMQALEFPLPLRLHGHRRTGLLFVCCVAALARCSADLTTQQISTDDGHKNQIAAQDNTTDCACHVNMVLDTDCCSCTVSQVAEASSAYFKELLLELVQTPIFRVYTPYPDYPGQELYDVECSIPEFRELAEEIGDLQMGCAIEQCGCSKDDCDTNTWRLDPCFSQCEQDELIRKNSVSTLAPTRPKTDGPAGVVQYDLVQNPEQFTGYGTLLDDKSAAKIWDSLYTDKFCFTSCPAETALEPSPERRLVYKIVSGLHASINTHLAMNYGIYTDTNEPATRQNWGFGRDLHFGEWRQLFADRVGAHPDRIRNMHFIFAILIRAMHRLAPYLDQLLQAGSEGCGQCASNHNQTRHLLAELVQPPENAPPPCQEVLRAFDDSVLFSDQARANGVLKDDVLNRFERMGHLMTCVGCDRCKLWGTLQFHAVRVALGILLGDNDANLAHASSQFEVPHLRDLKPNDVVALVNALAQVSKSIDQAKAWASSEA